MCNFGFRQGYGLLTEEMIMYLTDQVLFDKLFRPKADHLIVLAEN